MNIDISRTINRAAFFSRSPELVGVVAGIRFYECAICGDERPLIAVTDDRCGYSFYYDVPTLEELTN